MPRDRQTKMVMQVPMHCESEEKDINVAFYLRGEVPKTEITHLSDSLVRSFSVAAAIAHSAFISLPRMHRWVWYGLMDVPVTVLLEEVSLSVRPLETVVEIALPLAEALRVETARRQETKNAFEKAKEFLWKVLSGELDFEAHEVRNAAAFIEQCRRTEVWSYGDFMDDTRHRELLPEIEHLLRLKNPAHSTVRASGRARDILYNTRFPEFWREAPPQPSAFGL